MQEDGVLHAVERNHKDVWLFVGERQDHDGSVAMKPGRRDTKYHVLITGKELQELKRYAYTMAESFGLDRRVMQYQGKRPLGLYRWDIECLLDTIADEIQRPANYPSQASEEYQAFSSLYKRIQDIYREIEREDAQRK